MTTVRCQLVSVGLVGAFLGQLIGCIPSFADDESLIEEARVLAVRSEPAEPRPGDPVSLFALVASPTASSVANEELRWRTCVARRPLTELGPVAPDCIADFAEPASPQLSDIGAGLEVETILAADVCRRFGPLAPPPEPGSSVSGRPVDPDSTGGFYQPIVLGFDAPSLSSIRLFCGAANLLQEEVIIFNQGYRPNENPKVAMLRAETAGISRAIEVGEALSVGPGAKVTFRVSWAACPEAGVCGDGLCTAGENATSCAEDCRTQPRGCEGSEVYLLPDLATRRVKTAREELRVAWFTTAGTFTVPQSGADESGLTSSNDWSAPTTPGSVSMWVVLRDDRGGVDWRELTLEVSP